MKKEYILYGIIAILSLGIVFLLLDKFNNSDEDYFENNLECQKYLKNFKKSGWSDNDYNHAIFYSPRENTCLGVYRSAYQYTSGMSLSLSIKDIFNPDEKFSYYLREEGSGSLINSLFQKNRCSDLDDQSKNCNIEDYEDLVKTWNKEIEWLKGK